MTSDDSLNNFDKDQLILQLQKEKTFLVLQNNEMYSGFLFVSKRLKDSFIELSLKEEQLRSQETRLQEFETTLGMMKQQVDIGRQLIEGVMQRVGGIIGTKQDKPSKFIKAKRVKV
jgi:hypothetical protein